MKYINNLLISLVFFLLPVAGCIQGQATVFLNPDGSGKVTIETVLDTYNAKEKAKIWQEYQNAIAQIKESLLKSEGVDAWTNVDWRIMENGKLYFKGQAYFKSINNVAINLGDLKGNLRVYYYENENGQHNLELKSFESEPNGVEWTAQRQNSAQRYKLFSPDMENMLKGLRLDVIFVLPAKAEKAEGFEEIDERTIHYIIDGNRLTYLLDYIRERELYKLAERWNYNRIKFLNNELLPMHLNNRGPISASFADTKENLFDYEQEKTNAKNDIIAIVDKLDAAAATAKIKQRQSEINEKRNQAEQGTVIQPDTPINSQLRSGLVLEAKGEYEQAINIYTKIIDSNEAETNYLAQAYYRRGMCLFEMGSDDKAIEQFHYVITTFSFERAAAVRASNMIRDMKNGTAVRKADARMSEPTIIGSLPELYVEDVNFGMESITIEFSRPMETSNWLYSSFEPGKLPQVTGEPTFDSSGQRWTLPVKLEPFEVYAIAFNCGDAVQDSKKIKAGFRSETGEKCKPFVLVFATMDEDNVPAEINDELLQKSEQINLTESMEDL